MIEKGLHEDACQPMTLPNGRVVQVQHDRFVPYEYVNIRNSTKFGSSNGLNLFFERADHTIVRLTFGAYDQPASTSAARQKVAATWVDGYTDRLAEVVADQGMSPDAATTAPAEQSDHDRDQAILQSALGPSFTLYDGGVQLEPGSLKSAELPDGTYGAKAELSTITAAAYHAACDAKAGLAACETKTLGDGTVVRLRSWADREATDDQMRGESAVYVERKDGSVLLANLEVTGSNVTAAKADEHAKVVRQWLESLQPALIAAITDEHVAGTPATN